MNIQPGDDTIARFRTGERKAFGIIYTHYYRYVFVIACTILRREDEARDIASEIFLKLWAQRGRFKKAGEVKGWLIIACRRASLNELRTRQRRQIIEKELGLVAEKELPSYEHEWMEWERICQLLRLLEALPPRCREVVDLMFLQGRKTAEVAAALGISPITVQSHKTNALLKLRAFRSIHKF